MKLSSRFLLGCALLVAMLQPLRAAVTFTVSPSVISNTYNGYITLLITGLTNSAPVLVQKYLDASGDGVIDPSEPLWQQFSLTDGVNFQIGGVTNLNVPGDLDTTTGQITARLNFQGDFSQQFSGTYLFELSSPGGYFTSITNSLVVTNFPYPQQFSGTVYNNGVPVPYAGVMLLQAKANGNFNPVLGTVANVSGAFTLPAPAGTYGLVAIESNYIANGAAAANLVLSNGMTFTTNLTLLSTAETISGNLQVAGNPTQGLPAVLVNAQTTTGFIGAGLSGMNGLFTIGVNTNNWKLSIDNGGLAFLGYVGPGDKTSVSTADGSVSGESFNLPLGTALFYGSVKDQFGNPLPGPVTVEANDQNLNTYNSEGFTDGNGNFVVTAIGGLGESDLWYVQVENGSSFPTYIFSEPAFDEFGGTNIASGTAVPASMIGIVATNQISGRVFNTNGAPLVGVGVSAFFTTNGYIFNNYLDTDTNGDFTFTVGAGAWQLSVNSQFGSDSLTTLLGSGTFQPPMSYTIIITNSNVATNFYVQPCGGVQILTTNLPSGQVGVYYSYYLFGSTCSGFENWSVSDPLDMPGNMSLSVNGQLQGNPTNSGTFLFTVQLNDGNGNSTNSHLSLTISPQASTLQINTTSLPGATTGNFYDFGLGAFGGTAPYHWSLFSGSLPPNLNFSTNGILSGTPTNTGTYPFTVEVIDFASNTATQALSLTIGNTPLQITSTVLSNATQNAGYTNHLSATGGAPPYTWSLAPGSANLPAGLTLATNGAISGAPIGNGTSEFIVEATDSTSTFTTQVLSLTVNSSSLPQTIKLSLATPPTSGQIQFSFKIASGVTYTVQSSTDLIHWTDYETFNFSNGSTTSGETWIVTIPNPSGVTQTFYRVKVGQ